MRAWTALGLLLLPSVVGCGALLSPHVPVSIELAEPLTFGGSLLTSVAALVVLSRTPVLGRARAVLLAGAVVLLAIAAFAHPPAAWAAVMVGAALVALAHAVGDLIGSRVEHPGHLLPACVVAAAIDIVSVLHPQGVSHAVLTSERALSLLTISFPVLGTPVVAPTIGVGDLLFIALVLGTARSHRLAWKRLAVLAVVALVLAGALSALIQMPVPALPLIGLLVVVGLPAARQLRPKDRTVALAFMAGTVALAIATVVSRFWGTGVNPLQ